MKVVFVGNTGTGKSSVLRELAGIPTTERTNRPTQGCHLVKCNVNGNELEVWDVSGDSKYAPFRAAYFANTDVCVVFGNESSWKQEVLSVSPGARVYNFTTTEELKTFLEKNG